MKMDAGFAAAKQDLKKELNGIHVVLDAHTAMLERDETERLALGVQVKRHDDWIERAAPKVGVRYSHTN